MKTIPMRFRVHAWRALAIAVGWITAAWLTERWFHLGGLPFSLIWPPNGIAYGFAAAYGMAAVAPAALGVLVWNLFIQRLPPTGALLGTASFALSLALVAWALPRLRRAPGDDRSAVRDALQYYGVLIGLGVSLDTALGIAQYAHSAAGSALSLPDLAFIYWFSGVFGVLFFSRATELAARAMQARLRPGPTPQPLRAPAPCRRDEAAVWLLAWALFVALCVWLIRTGLGDYAQAVGYLSLLLLAVAMFRFRAGFAHFALMLIGVSQVVLVELRLGDSMQARIVWADQSVLVSVIGVFGLLGIATVAQQRWTQQRLAKQAQEDLLTGLRNDRGYAQAIASAQPSGPAYLLGVEIQRREAIDELVGPQHAQDVEGFVAKALQDCCPADCALARLHEGFFALISPSEQQARVQAEAIWAVLEGRRLQFDDQTVWLHVAVGATPLRPDLGAAEQMALLALATQVAGDRFDHRIHFAQGEGESLIEARRAQRRLLSQLEAALHAPPWRAVEGGRKGEEDDGDFCAFELYAQPIVDLRGSRPPSCEILLRWRVGGELRSPASFLPLAERHGLMPAIDRWVLRHTLDILAGTPRAFDLLDHVSINLSGASLSDAQLLADLRDAVRRSAVSARRLCFEITESFAIHNPQQARELVRGLREMGAALSLDDFGTGLASFAYLKTFAFDQIKIDGLFIKDLARSAQDQTTVEAICMVARSMGLRTVAEFVENQAVIDILREKGVDAVQGYGVGRPEPLLAFLGGLTGRGRPSVPV
ncbi:MAG: EAL domain-containing protein [Thiomonas sp.]